jgi:GrpB-like predicted nucleotidyltransferase (UPF0157 family)
MSDSDTSTDGREKGKQVSDTKKSDWETGLIGGREKRVIEIVPYRSDWPLRFQSHAERIKNALGATMLRVEHIGSTSVDGLAAKPIIDILVVVADPAREDLYLPGMLSAGYELRVREPEFEEHRMFRTPERDVHVHFFPANSGEIERYLQFRDFVRAHAETRDQYAALKRELSKMDWTDMNEYANAKTDFIEGVIRRARNIAGC